jgi:Glycosyl transferases group 1
LSPEPTDGSRKGSPTILLSGMIAAIPDQGGATWAVLQYLLGFRRLGYRVVFVESIPETSMSPEGVPPDRTRNAAYFRRVMEDFGFDSDSALLIAGTRRTVGLSYEGLRRVARSADLLINISGMLTDEELTVDIPCRVYLDLDPTFNQLWHALGVCDMRFRGHTHFVTIGLAIGRPDCNVPTCGLPWITTAQPVVLSEWPVARRITHDALTTIGHWRSYGSIEHEGTLYGQKAHSLRRFIALPTLTDERFLLALAIHPDEHKDLAALAANGWQSLDPAQVAGTPADYRRFIRGSKAEFGIAKSGYVESRCGWISDRSLCYLASGRPVLAQETGFSDFIPAGEGLFAFESTADILAAIEELRSRYARHARAARAIAEEAFDSDKVLSRLLDRLSTT